MKKQRKNTENAIKDSVYSKREREIMEAIERDELVSVSREEFEKIKKEAEQAARNTIAMRKDKTISIRISSKDLQALREMATEQGMPYQTFITSILHRYIGGLLVSSKTTSKVVVQKTNHWKPSPYYEIKPVAWEVHEKTTSPHIQISSAQKIYKQHII